MKLLIPPLIILSSFLGQSELKPYNSLNKENFTQEDPRILKIRKWYGEIRRNIDNKVYGIRNTANYGNQYYSKADKKLAFVLEEALNDGHELSEEYYLKDDKLFFYYSKEISVYETKPLPEGMTQQEAWETGALFDAQSYEIKEQRIYFNNDKVIRYLTKTKVLDVDKSKDFDKDMLKVPNKTEDINLVKTDIYITTVNRFIKNFNE